MNKITSTSSEQNAGNTAYAAIDLGTNNCRMLIAQKSADGFEVIDSFSRIVRLGEGVSSAQALSEHAIARTINALRICADKISTHQVRATRFVATEACRRATNRNAFIDRVFHETSLTLEPIDTREEARLTLNGCAPLLDSATRYAMVFDIGGGSTEIMWVACAANNTGTPHMLDMISIPHGVVTLSEDFAHHTDKARDAIQFISTQLHAFDQKNNITQTIHSGGVQLLGTSGTVTTLGGVLLDLERYDRSKVDGLSVSLQDMRNVADQLRDMPHKQRSQHPCIGPKRADLMPAGCAILEAICHSWPVDAITIADRGIREGVLMDLINADTTAHLQSEHTL